MRLFAVCLAILALAACSGHPIEAGGYDVLVVDAPVNDCGVDDTALGIGNTLSVSLSWQGDELHVGGLGPNTVWDTPDDGHFSTSWEESMVVESPCSLASTFDFLATITSTTSFDGTDDIVQLPDGDCSAHPEVTTCSIQVTYSGTKAE